MIVRFAFVFWLLLPAFCSVAAGLRLGSLTVGSTTYSNVTVLGANTTDIYFKHDHGIANVKLRYLGPELQKKFDYDPKAAAEAEKKQSEDDALYQNELASRVAAEAAKKVAQPGNKAVVSSEDSLADPISDRSLLGKVAPPLDLDTWLSDKPVLEGKFVLVAFWAPWSIPCRKWIPDLNALQKEFHANLVVVGVCSESESEIAEMSATKLEFPAGIDSRGILSAVAGVTSVPCVLLLDPKGIVRYAGHPAALTEKKLQAFFAKTAE
jgi:thiol-disulfide isomerase/thioredoxin